MVTWCRVGTNLDSHPTLPPEQFWLIRKQQVQERLGRGLYRIPGVEFKTGRDKTMSHRKLKRVYQKPACIHI